jgi:hypothetical protein
VEIRRKLQGWLNGDGIEDAMMRVFGSAGTRKSAVAQTFTEDCAKVKRHGASYFFSRQGRDEANTVVATLANQLCVNCSKYKEVLAGRLANDLVLFEKALPIQFQEAIVEPFMKVQDDGPLKSLAVVLDGLDGCKEERSQRDLIKMIAKVVRDNKNLPLLWFVCSRLESHLKHEYTGISHCGKEELVLDTEARDDAERYLRDELARIKRDDFVLVDLPEWPMEAELMTILQVVSGLFVYASPVVRYIGDSGGSGHTRRLQALLSFLNRTRKTITTNPLEAFDLPYLQILNGIPKNVFPNTWPILAHLTHHPKMTDSSVTLQPRVLCNFLHFDQQPFYDALRNIFSVMHVPSAKDVDRPGASSGFYHASFQEFVTDPTRSRNLLSLKKRLCATSFSSGMKLTQPIFIQMTVSLFKLHFKY